MEKVFIIRVSIKLFEPMRKNSDTLIVKHKDVVCMDVAKLDYIDLRFSEYIMEDGVPVGVRLWCDYGHGYGFDNGNGVIALRPGDTAEFSCDGTSVDDEGDPEDYSIDYHLELLKWDDRLIGES